MSRVIFHPVFIFLLLGIQLEAAYVEPPTNVTLDCHNLRHVVKWSYAQFSPGLQFRIFIGALLNDPKEFLVDSPDLQADFSLDTDPADTFNLVVSAVVGQNESDDVPREGIPFSYNKNSAAPKKCFMDLAAVNVTATRDGVAFFSFMHPWLLYRDKIPTMMKRHNAGTEVFPEFKYEVLIVSKGTSEIFYCSESECEEELSVDPQEEKLCLKISGEMEKMAIQGTQEYCTMLPTATPVEDDFTYIIYIMVALLVVIVLAFILFMVYKKLTSPDPYLPPSMTTIKGHLWRAVGPVPSPDQVSVPEVEPASPTPLLPATEFPPAFISFTEPEVRERMGVLTEDEGVCDDGEIGKDEECGYTQGRDLEEGDINFEPSSGYEKRPGV